jgi:hypothetical protein
VSDFHRSIIANVIGGFLFVLVVWAVERSLDRRFEPLHN